MAVRKTAAVSIRLRPDTRDALYAEAERKGLKPAEHIRNVLQSEVEQVRIMQQVMHGELSAGYLEPALEQPTPAAVTHIELNPDSKGIITFSGMAGPEVVKVMNVIQDWLKSGTSHLFLSLPDGAHLEFQLAQVGPDMSVDWRDTLSDEWCKCQGEVELKSDGEHEVCVKCGKPMVCVWSFVSPYYDPQRLHAAEELCSGHVLCHHHARQYREGPANG